ncbi:MAG: xanthine dehydrogenase family protein molybdopterin-binding subunit [Gemmatimonadaceae bacterium]|nr:xanthine dehydrogenase family protein molybdopterin-binding subunit [Gemmatimonadaceae bacterium]
MTEVRGIVQRSARRNSPIFKLAAFRSAPHLLMMSAVGSSVARKDGIGKATGGARYIDDLVFPGMLHGRTIRSTVPRGRIKSIRLDFDTSGFTVVDYRDVPAKNAVDLMTQDQPFLTEREVKHMAEPVLLLAHENKERLNAATVVIEYEEQEPLFDPEKSTEVFKEVEIVKGDAESALAGSDVIIVEGTYRTGHQEHVYIEPNGVIAVPEEGGIAVYGSMQCPFYVLKALRCMLGSAYPNVRVIQTETGGGFGGKEEYPSIISGHAVLLALKSGRPVKIVYDREEDMIATTKRHPSIVRHRTGVTRDGRLVAMDVDVLMDGGAYATLSPTVLSRGCIHASGPYKCDNIRIRGRTVFTNTPPNGAFRGFGAPQTEFAVEVHMDRIAEQLGMDSVELRRINALRPGDTTATGQVLRDDASAHMVLDEAVRRTDFARKRREWKGTNRSIGLSLFYHGAGFTGAGERNLKSKARLDLTPTGVRIAVGSTEIGQGTRTMHAQIVTDALGMLYESVEVAQPDTSRVADSGPTVASRTCMVVGKILEECAHEMKDRLGGLSPAEYHARHGPISVERMYEPPDWIVWDEQTYRGDAYATYGWGCDVAELELDPDTYEVKPIRFTAVQEFGRPIHPALARGQIEGGTAQGLGYALLERVVMRNGAMANSQLTNYVIPTTLDMPEMDVVMMENPYPGGPFGAKGLGELPMDGPAPAIVNALRSLGLDVREIPATPELLATCMTA